MTHYGGWCRSRLIGGCAKPVGLCSFPSKAAGTAPWCWRGGGPVPRAAGDPCQTPAESLSLFVPSILGQDMGRCWMRNALWLYAVLMDVSRWDQKPWERVLVLVGREVSAQDLPQELGAGFGSGAGAFSILPFLLG